MATWIQMLATSSFIYWYCVISVDFAANSAFSNPSHAQCLHRLGTKHKYDSDT